MKKYWKIEVLFGSSWVWLDGATYQDKGVAKSKLKEVVGLFPEFNFRIERD